MIIQVAGLNENRQIIHHERRTITMTKNTETLSGAEAVQAGFSHSKTIEITMAALFIALTYVATAFINVRIPFLAANGGLIHLGNIPLFVAA